jgi:Putative transposase/Transposase zinc-binding domain
MTRPPPEVADVVQQYGAAYLARYGHSTSTEQHRVLRALALCRTAALGGHTAQCDHCGHLESSYNSCRNRHCPKCQGSAQAAWLAAREREILDVPSFHVVFTLPDALNGLALQNPRPLYTLLFQTVAETLVTIARDPQHLGADIGCLAILHTWGQQLHYHPHLHCVVPGGGLAPDGTHWVACRKHFFLPVRVLSRLFRRRFLEGLGKASIRDALTYAGRCQALADAQTWQRFLQALRRHEWVVYAKRPFGEPQWVLKYLARYTHRVAISNRRLLALEDGRVTFRWKDYAHGNRHRLMTLDAVEFIRRFLLHILPRGFQRIRHYGFLANSVRQEKLVLCRQLLRQPVGLGLSAAPVLSPGGDDAPAAPSSAVCPVCQTGRMLVVETLFPLRAVWDLSTPLLRCDTS